MDRPTDRRIPRSLNHDLAGSTRTTLQRALQRLYRTHCSLLGGRCAPGEVIRATDAYLHALDAFCEAQAADASYAADRQADEAAVSRYAWAPTPVDTDQQQRASGAPTPVASGPPELLELPALRLLFVRWLVRTGRLSETLAGG